MIVYKMMVSSHGGVHQRRYFTILVFISKVQLCILRPAVVMLNLKRQWTELKLPSRSLILMAMVT